MYPEIASLFQNCEFHKTERHDKLKGDSLPVKEQFLDRSEGYGKILLNHSFVSNSQAGTASLLVQAFESHGTAEPFDTPAPSEQLVVVISKGQGEVESFHNGF